MEKLKFGFIISGVFFLIFVELAILFKNEVSLFAILENASVALVALFY